MYVLVKHLSRQEVCLLRFSARAERETFPPGEMPVHGREGGAPGWSGRAGKLFVAWVIVPPLLLCMAELALRLAGYGIPMGLFVPRELDGKTVCVANSAFYQQFYTTPFGTTPIGFSMPAEKPPDTYRIFVFGSSAAQGGPVPDFSFWGILETMLRAGRHERPFEIYCLALAGADSHVMRAAAQACAAYQPDLFLVYMGNNELNPLVSQSTAWDRLPPRLALWCLRLATALNNSSIVQLLHGVKLPADLGRLHPPSRRIEPERAYQYYQSNVNDICGFAKAAGAQVVLCTVGTRLRDWIPDGRHAAVLDSKAARLWEDAYDAGNMLREGGRFRDALDAYSRAADLDSGHAGLAYGIACCRHALGDYADARRWFVRARELDGRCYRARTRINEILRETAAARARDGVHLADTAQSLADASPHGIEGPEFFLDHVHPTFEGNCVLARSVLETLVRIEPRLGTQTPPMSIEECRLRQAMTQPDFRDQLAATATLCAALPGMPENSLERAMAELDTQIGTRGEDMRLDACRHALEIDPRNDRVRTRYVRLLSDKKDAANAFEQAKILAADLPYSWEALRLLAPLLATAGERARAIETLRRALALRPDDASMHMQLGQLLHDEKQPEPALAAFRAASTLGVTVAAQLMIGCLLREQGDFPGAIKAYRRSLQSEPGNLAAFEGLILALCDANLLAEANGEMGLWRAAFGEQPCGTADDAEKAGPTQDASGHPHEGKFLETRVSVLRQLFRLLPCNLGNSCRFQDLLMAEAARLETAGDLPGAVSAYRSAIPLNRDNVLPVRNLEKTLSKSSPAARRDVWESVWKDNPDFPMVAMFCGAARAATEDIAGAHKAFAAAQRIAPEDWSYCVMAADAFAAAGAWKDAVAAIERALAINPGLDYLHSRLDTAKKNAAEEPFPDDQAAAMAN